MFWGVSKIILISCPWLDGSIVTVFKLHFEMISGVYMKSLNAKTDISIFINFRYLRLKLLKNKENNKKIYNIFHYNFKNIPCVKSEVSLIFFALFDDGLTLKTVKLAYI